MVLSVLGLVMAWGWFGNGLGMVWAWFGNGLGIIPDGLEVVLGLSGVGLGWFGAVLLLVLVLLLLVLLLLPLDNPC